MDVGSARVDWGDWAGRRVIACSGRLPLEYGGNLDGPSRYDSITQLAYTNAFQSILPKCNKSTALGFLESVCLPRMQDALSKWEWRCGEAIGV